MAVNTGYITSILSALFPIVESLLPTLDHPCVTCRHESKQAQRGPKRHAFQLWRRHRWEWARRSNANWLGLHCADAQIWWNGWQVARGCQGRPVVVGVPSLDQVPAFSEIGRSFYVVASCGEAHPNEPISGWPVAGGIPGNRLAWCWCWWLLNCRPGLKVSEPSLRLESAGDRFAAHQQRAVLVPAARRTDPVFQHDARLGSLGAGIASAGAAATFHLLLLPRAACQLSGRRLGRGSF